MTKAIRQLLRIYKSLPNEKAQEYLSELPAHLNETPPSSELFQSLWMTWDMIREMKASGMCVGGHTNTHPVLSKLVPEDQANEIRTCARRLREELGAPMECFSYPVGHRDSFDGTTREFLKAEGCQYGFSYYGGIGQLRPTDSLDIPRFPVETETSRKLFVLMVSMPTTYLAMHRY